MGAGSGNMPLLIYRSKSSQRVSIHRGAMLPAAAGASIIEESRSAYIVTGSSTGLSVRGKGGEGANCQIERRVTRQLATGHANDPVPLFALVLHLI